MNLIYTYYETTLDVPNDKYGEVCGKFIVEDGDEFNNNDIIHMVVRSENYETLSGFMERIKAIVDPPSDCGCGRQSECDNMNGCHISSGWSSLPEGTPIIVPHSSVCEEHGCSLNEGYYCQHSVNCPDVGKTSDQM